MKYTFFYIPLYLLIFAPNIDAQAETYWKYQILKNNFDDSVLTFAWTSAPNYQYKNDFSVGFKCKKDQLYFEVDVDTFITAKGETFNFQYRVDDNEVKTIEMKTLSYTNNAGSTRKFAKRMAQEIIGGKRMKMRVIGWSNSFFDADISLLGAAPKIKNVFGDCLVNISSSESKTSKLSYSLEKFLNDFKKLTPKLKRNILATIEKIMPND